MIFDNENLFSSNQAVTASAASTNIVDLGDAEDRGPGSPIEIEALVTEAFATLTSLTVGLQSSTDAAFTSPVTHYSTGAIAQASLTAGKRIAIPAALQDVNRYIRLYYTVSGSNATAGKVYAGVVSGRQAWQPVAGNQF